MKHLGYFILLAGLAFACGAPKTSGNAMVERSFKVWGNCEQCKATIEKAGKLAGVSAINWSEDSDTLTVKTDTTVTNTDDILKAIAGAGYDNERYIADADAYHNLPECCQYERKQ